MWSGASGQWVGPSSSESRFARSNLPWSSSLLRCCPCHSPASHHSTPPHHHHLSPSLTRDSRTTTTQPPDTTTTTNQPHRLTDLYLPNPKTQPSSNPSSPLTRPFLFTKKQKRSLSKMSFRSSTRTALKQALQAATSANSKRSFSLVAKAAVRPQVARTTISVSRGGGGRGAGGSSSCWLTSRFW